ncbi:MAG: hypothetical protein PF447_04420, partial [Spirochaetaceae bacterium]|nr:hypothetical protein [Spirochaetaceae bacterium]
MQEDNSINIIFYLGNIRSGTKYIASFLSKNARNTSSLHEPFPDMFGPSILARHENRDKAIRRLFALKRRAIRLFSRKNYFESNHAFLKSFCHVAMESFPQMKLLHSIR